MSSPFDVIRFCELGQTYKCCCVTNNNSDTCCYNETCEEYS